ncbi:MAG TPA: hypothetical protein PKA37_14070, partial [Planctomycetota bacterium]|nr:hypothetical protein [Planctomycetota bacterium]
SPKSSRFPYESDFAPPDHHPQHRRRENISGADRQAPGTSGVHDSASSEGLTRPEFWSKPRIAQIGRRAESPEASPPTPRSRTHGIARSFKCLPEAFERIRLG